MTIKEALIFGATKLKKAKINSARLDAEIILSFVLKKSKEFLFTYPEKKLTAKQAEKFQQFIAKRVQHFPVSYMTHIREFFGLSFFVNQHVLIPRPETEILVKEVIKIINNITTTNAYVSQKSKIKSQKFRNNSSMTLDFGLLTFDSALTIADVGTGSGCVIISLAKNIPNAQFYAVDKSAKALVVAKKNARNIVPGKIKFYHGNLLAPLKNKRIDIMVANLPYVESNLKKIIKNSESASLKYEPRTALVAGRDGLSLYKRLLKQVSELTTKPRFIFLEIGDKQAIGIKKLIKKNLPQSQIEIIQDLARKNRVLKITVDSN